MTDEHTHGRRSFLKRIGAATTLAGLAGQGSTAPAARTVIVGVEDGATIEEVRADIDADPSIPGRARVVHHNEVIDYAVVEIPGPSPQANERAHEAVGKHSSVRYAEQDYEITLAVEEVEAITPNDPRWGDEWAEQAMNVPTAWETTLGSLDTTLAILDTGLDVTHEDLAPRTTDEIGGSDPVPSGADDHGTHCGGCAAATTGNGVGVSGVSNARLLGYNIFDNSRGEDAIIEAADLGADVISLSWSVGYSTQQSLADAIQYATDQGTVVVAASANDGRTDSVTYPALDPNVIAVGATDQNGNVASFSNSGPELDVVAPGVSILSTLPQNSYGRASGTSMACPNTAGVVALAKELDPSLTTEEVRTLLTETATTLSGVPAGRQAAGQVDAAAVVDRLSVEQGPYGRSSPWPVPGRIQAEDYDVGGQGEAYNDTESANVHGAYRSDGVDIEQSAGGGYDVAEIRSGEWLEYTVSVEQAGTYDLTARVSSDAGGGALRVAVDGTDVTGTVDVPATGGWQSWTTVSATGIDLSAGEHVVRLTMEADLFNIDWFEFSAAGLVDGATYQITNVTSGKALDVAAGSTQDGANVHQWEYVGGDNQHWTLEAVGDGTYRLLAAHSGKALDVAGISDQDGANVHQWAYVGGANQHWRIEPVGDGSYRLLADHSGKALDVSGAGTTDGTNVQQWPVNGNDAQHWTFQER